VAHAGPPTDTEDALLREVSHLPTGLRSVALLALTGHSRREITYLLRLSDTALRQRIVAVKRRLRSRGLEMPDGFAGLTLDLAYGRIRKALLPQVVQHGWFMGSHDPDGHLFFMNASQSR
jgi:RNA polymerase sigma-70 factor (ECF subfamily)